MKVQYKFIFSVICLLTLILNGCGFSSESRNQKELYDLSSEEFHDVIDQRIPKLMKKYGVPGVAIALIHEGKTDFSKTYGYADKKRKIPVDDSTLFQGASLSKSFTAWGVLKLVEEGKIELDAPVENYLTRWHLPPSDWNKDEITIRRLLSHTAGIGEQAYKGYLPGEPLPTLEEMLSGNGNSAPLTIKYKPGERFVYSGAGYSLLQLVIEEITGSSYAVYMKEQILDPLGLTSSSFILLPEMKNHLAKAYDCLGQTLPNYRYVSLSAAGIIMTIGDLARFASAGMFKHNKSILNEETVEMSFETAGRFYGLGCYNYDLTDKTYAVSHGGDNRGWTSGYMIIPDTGEGLAILTNSENGQNLIWDILNTWTQWNTRGIQPFYNKLMTLRSYLKSAALILGIVLLCHGTYVAVTFFRKKRSFFLKAKKGITSKILSLILPVLFYVLWLLFFYTGIAFDGWQPAPRIPDGFSSITLVITIWCALFLLTGLFRKENTKGGLKKI